MSSDALRKRFAYAASAALIATAACGAEAPDDWAQTQSSQVAPVDQAGDRAFAVRASIAILGRPPRDNDEVQQLLQQMGTSTVDAERRTALAAFLLDQEDFVRHWTSVLYDLFQVSREPDFSFGPGLGRSRETCWNTPTTSPPELAEYVATQAPTTTVPLPAGVDPAYTMLDLVRASVAFGDLRTPLRANLFAQMATPIAGNQMSERNIRADYWTRFERSYLNRQITCLGCHSTQFSVTGVASDWNRFYPLPDLVEDATLESADGTPWLPPDLMADFRFNGVAGFFQENVGGMSFISNTTGHLPWHMGARPDGRVACAAFSVGINGDAATPPPETPCSPTPAEELPPDDTVGMQDVCFSDNGTRRQPTPKFLGTNTQLGSVYSLHNHLISGIGLLATNGLPVEVDVLRPVQPVGTAEGAQRAFAIMVAESIVEKVWEEVFGSRLTLAHHYPRHPDSRNAIYELARALVQSTTEAGTPWSLRYLLTRIVVDRPEFNAATGVGEQYPFGVVFNPWELPDPRGLETDCAPNPTFEGCVRGLLRKHQCDRCHENPDGVAQTTRFAHGDLARLTTDPPADPLDVSLVVDTASCQATVDSDPVGCATVDCGAIGDRPASLIALAVGCGTMPPDAPMDEEERTAIVQWVAAGNQVGAPFPPLEEPTSENTRNSVGDRVHWKSPFQLTLTSGRALLDPAVIDAWALPFPQGGGYPTPEIAEIAGQYFHDGKPGGRGLSLLSLVDWERAHSSAGVPCRIGTGPDRIDAMVAAAAANSEGVEGLVRDLKHSFFGEDGLDPVVDATGDEATLLDDVLETAGVTLGTIVTPANSASVGTGLRNVCNVFLRSPLFMLSYLESPEAQVMVLESARRSHGRRGHHRPRGPHDPLILPDLCAGRLDCRQYSPITENVVGNCWDDRRSCRGGEAQRATDQVKRVLEDRRLPVERPEMDLERALVELPAAVPTGEDPRLGSPVLVLPLDGGRITRLHGSVLSLSGGAFRSLRRGDTIRYGDALFIPRGVRLRIEANGQVFSTDHHGMEKPPELDDDDRGHHGHHRRHRHRGRHHGHHHHDEPPVWIVLANGAQARTAPHPGMDPGFLPGNPLGGVISGPRDGLVPRWASYGEARLWYALPE